MSPIVVTGTFSGQFDTLVVFPGLFSTSKFMASYRDGLGLVLRP